MSINQRARGTTGPTCFDTGSAKSAYGSAGAMGKRRTLARWAGMMGKLEGKAVSGPGTDDGTASSHWAIGKPFSRSTVNEGWGCARFCS